MFSFYRGTIESILTSCITVWYGACTVSCRKTLQRTVKAAEKIIGVSLPSLLDIYNTRLTRKATRIAGDPTHPSHSLFNLLPSGRRRVQSLRAKTSRLKDSFFHQAVRTLNSLPVLPPLAPPLAPTIDSGPQTLPMHILSQDCTLHLMHTSLYTHFTHAYLHYLHYLHYCSNTSCLLISFCPAKICTTAYLRSVYSVYSVILFILLIVVFKVVFI